MAKNKKATRSLRKVSLSFGYFFAIVAAIMFLGMDGLTYNYQISKVTYSFVMAFFAFIGATLIVLGIQK
jgi:cytochrome bd-type quinol oxidase subunit 2